MNTVVLVIVVAVVLIAAIVFFFMRKKKLDEGVAPEETAPTREEAVLPSEEIVSEEARAPPEEPQEVAPQEAVEEEAVPEEKPKEPERPAPPGVRLDDKAEAQAAKKLEEARRERKLKRLRQGLAPTRGGFIKKIGDIFRAKKEISPEILNELEETLIGSDVGVKTTEWLIEILKQALEKDELADSDAVWDLLREEVRQVLQIEAPPIDIRSTKPYVVIVVGVNGVGKTTTIGKLATQYIDQGRKVVLAAADTFRAAAVNQLEIWGRRSGAEVIKSKEGADPSSVVFDAIKKAEQSEADLVIADTAGRLHTKVPLMEEVKKIARVAG